MKQLLISFVAFLPLFTEAQWTDPETLAANAATRAIEAMGQVREENGEVVVVVEPTSPPGFW